MSVANPVIDHLDPAAKLIYLAAGVREYHPIEDLYREILRIRSTDDSTHWYQMPILAKGGEPKGGGKYTSRYAVFRFGWKVVPDCSVTHALYVKGEQITDDGQSGAACLDLSVVPAGISVFVQYEPPASELVKAEDELVAIKRMAYDERVTVNVDTGASGTAWPVGTLGQPVNNMQDALVISAAQDIDTFFIVTDMTIDSGLDYRGKTFVGASKTKTQIEITPEAQVDNCEFYDVHVSGTLDGDTTLFQCLIHSLNYVTGFIEQCVLESGPILLGAGAVAHFLDCWSGIAMPVIDMGGAGQALVMRNYAGEVTIINKTGPEDIMIGLAGGHLTLDPTVTAGTVTVKGFGTLLDNSNGATVNASDLINSVNIAKESWTANTTEVHIDVLGHHSGTSYPSGTSAHPVNNLVDAVLIAQSLGITGLCVHGALDLTGTFNGWKIVGQRGFVQDSINLVNATLVGCDISSLKVTGDLVNCSELEFTDVFLDNVTNVSGEMIRSRLYGSISVKPGTYFSGINMIAEGYTVLLDLQNSAATVSFDIDSGSYEFYNCADGLLEFNVKGGELYLDSTCTGTFYAEGVGTLENESSMVIDGNHLMDPESVADTTWNGINLEKP